MVRLRAWLLWWIALFWLWMLLVGEWNRVELIAGAIAATVAATVAESVRAVTGLRFRIPLRDVAAAWTVPAIVFVDFFIVVGSLFVSLWRRELVRGRFIVRDFDPGSGSAPRRFGSRAWRTYVAMLSPNSYVVDTDEELRSLLVHDLVPFRKSEEPAA